MTPTSREQAAVEREKLHAEDRAAIRAMELLPVRLAMFFIGVVIAAIAATYAYSASHEADQTRRIVQSLCPLVGGIADAPVPTGVTSLGLQISARSRVAYAQLHCSDSYGPLHAPSPRVIPLLPKGYR